MFHTHISQQSIWIYVVYVYMYIRQPTASILLETMVFVGPKKYNNNNKQHANENDETLLVSHQTKKIGFSFRRSECIIFNASSINSGYNFFCCRCCLDCLSRSWITIESWETIFFLLCFCLFRICLLKNKSETVNIWKETCVCVNFDRREFHLAGGITILNWMAELCEQSWGWGDN